MSNVVRTPGGHFVPGVSGNRSGRPSGFKGISHKISAATRDGDELLEFFLDVMRNPLNELDHRIDAAKWLWQYRVGKPPTEIDIKATIDSNQTSTLVINHYNSDDLLIMRDLLLHAAGANDGDENVIDVQSIDVIPSDKKP